MFRVVKEAVNGVVFSHLTFLLFFVSGSVKMNLPWRPAFDEGNSHDSISKSKLDEHY